MKENMYVPRKNNTDSEVRPKREEKKYPDQSLTTCTSTQRGRTARCHNAQATYSGIIY